MKFIGNRLRWPVRRVDRRFRIYVVEPARYESPDHDKVFQAAISSLLQPPVKRERADREGIAELLQQPFDLVTFPEAFLSVQTLIETLRLLHENPGQRLGCVHVGLRPAGMDGSHLLPVPTIRDLVNALRLNEPIEQDLRGFSTWLDQQSGNAHFNVGCLFTRDAKDNLRVCLHPKIVAASVESSPFPEANMQEANLLTLITLLPDDPRLLTVTLQPLLCSDMLHLSGAQYQSRPMEALITHAEAFGDDRAEHVDIVTVATCTRQQEHDHASRSGYRIWHQEFRDALRGICSDDHCATHHQAIVVLANFEELLDQAPGGLSGAFLPAPTSHSTFPHFVDISAWGKPRDRPRLENAWHHRGGGDPAVPLSTLCYLVMLRPSGAKVASMLGLTVNRLPRDAPGTRTSPHTFQDLHHRVAVREDADTITFAQENR